MSVRATIVVITCPGLQNP